MGRTNPTFRDELRAIQEGWGDYRRCLRLEDQRRFDELFGYAAEHADACSHQNPVDPVPAVLLSMLLEQQRRLDEVESELGMRPERVPRGRGVRRVGGSGDGERDGRAGDGERGEGVETR